MGLERARNMSRVVGAAAVLAAALWVAGAADAKPAPAGAQLSFGVQMARSGLWNEAFFRFQQAAQLDPGNPRILNNLAVASEARGDFEGALRFYQEALRINSNDAEVKRNYARFVEFYQSFKAGGQEADPEAKPEAAAESGTGDG